MEQMLKFHVREVERLVCVRFPACTQGNFEKMDTIDSHSGNTRLGTVGAMLGVVDLDGFGLKKFSKDFISFLKSISQIDQDNYPEILGTLIVISTYYIILVCYSHASTLCFIITKQKA